MGRLYRYFIHTDLERVSTSFSFEETFRMKCMPFNLHMITYHDCNRDKKHIY